MNLCSGQTQEERKKKWYTGGEKEKVVTPIPP
jgi:hypothetical protein